MFNAKNFYYDILRQFKLENTSFLLILFQYLAYQFLKNQAINLQQYYTMIETIVQFDRSSYPFDSSQQSPNLKLQTLIQCQNSKVFTNYKKKFQTIKNLPNPYIIKLLQIYQQSLILHLIYEHVSMSLAAYIKNYIQKYSDDDIVTAKKQIFRNLANDLCLLSQFLCSAKIFTKLQYVNLGVSLTNQSKRNCKLKLFLEDFEISKHNKQQLKQFYLKERKKILGDIEKELQIQKRSDYLPNYIIKGNKIIFTDQLSQTKTRKKKDQSPNQQKFDKSVRDDIFQKQKYHYPPRYGKSSTKPKKHKYSCNFQPKNHDFDFQEDKHNKSFNQQQNFSVTQTKSMKILVQHQKPTQKNRKNSYKLKITTFQQISIDKDFGDDYEFPLYRNSFTPETPSFYERDQAANARQQQKTKDYKQKVKQAKLKAEALLNKYLKNKNK